MRGARVLIATFASLSLSLSHLIVLVLQLCHLDVAAEDHENHQQFIHVCTFVRARRAHTLNKFCRCHTRTWPPLSSASLIVVPPFLLLPSFLF